MAIAAERRAEARRFLDYQPPPAPAHPLNAAILWLLVAAVALAVMVLSALELAGLEGLRGQGSAWLALLLVMVWAGSRAVQLALTAPEPASSELPQLYRAFVQLRAHDVVAAALRALSRAGQGWRAEQVPFAVSPGLRLPAWLSRLGLSSSTERTLEGTVLLVGTTPYEAVQLRIHATPEAPEGDLCYTPLMVSLLARTEETLLVAQAQIDLATGHVSRDLLTRVGFADMVDVTASTRSTRRSLRRPDGAGGQQAVAGLMEITDITITKVDQASLVLPVARATLVTAGEAERPAAGDDHDQLIAELCDQLMAAARDARRVPGARAPAATTRMAELGPSLEKPPA